MTTEAPRHMGFGAPDIRSGALPFPVVENSRDPYPHDLPTLATLIKGTLASDDEATVKRVLNTDWKKVRLNLSKPADREFAAQALALGIPVFHPFANFAALTFHPHLESMRTVNVAKGRKKDQVASLITTREHIETIFDYSKLPEGLTPEQVTALIDSFYDHSTNAYAGPFGFRGPAADHIPDHLTSVDEHTGIRTVQIIAPGYRCASNELLKLALTKVNEGNDHAEAQLRYLAVTSANISSNETGQDEPAHYRTSGIQQDFGDRAPGFVIVGNPRARRVRGRYPHHEPNSTSILDISRTQLSEGGKVSVYLARHGSLPDSKVAEVVEQNGLSLIIDESARPQLPIREYPSRIHTVFSRTVH